MTKNTLKQLIRKCINESLNENKMDVIASKAARNKPDKNVDENKMDATSAYVPRGDFFYFFLYFFSNTQPVDSCYSKLQLKN